MILTNYELSALDSVPLNKTGLDFDGLCGEFCSARGISRCPKKKFQETLDSLVEKGFIRKLDNGKYIKFSMYLLDGSKPLRVWTDEEYKKLKNQ